jgi:hypothetical protein
MQSLFSEGYMQRYFKATLATAVAAMAVSASASVIYQESFPGNSSSPLNGTTPAVANNVDGELNAGDSWSAGTGATSTVPAANAFNADGSVNLPNVSPNSTSAYLPFKPQSGFVYTYSAMLNVTENQTATGTPGSNWLGLGFTNTSTQATSGNRWSDSGGPGAAGWILHRGSYTGTNTDQTFGGTGTANSANVAGTAGLITDPADVLITLNTGGTKWSVTWQIRDDTVGGAYTTIRTFNYTTNPTINFIGFTALASGGTSLAGQVTNLELDVTPAPEPAAISLLGLGLFQILRSRRRVG